MKRLGANFFVIGVLTGFAAILSQSLTAGYIALGCLLLGALPFVLQPILPKKSGKHASYLQPAPIMGGNHPNLVNHDRRHGYPPY